MSTDRIVAIMFAVLLLAGGVKAQQPVFPIAPGVAVEGNLNEATRSTRYSFEADAEAEITLRMEATSGEVDPLLLLIGPDGVLLNQNDDAEPGVSAAELALTTPIEGTYIVEATRSATRGGDGTYSLLLTIEGVENPTMPMNPLSEPPPFGVAFTEVGYGEFGAGDLNQQTPRRYFAVGGQRGDLVRAVMRTINGEFTPQARLLNADLREISTAFQPATGETIAFATLPETGWYLIELSRGNAIGQGSFSLYVDGIAGQVLRLNEEPITGAFTMNTPTLAYTFNATIEDQLFPTLSSIAEDLALELRLLDISYRTIAVATGRDGFQLRAVAPRTGPYILQVNNLLGGAGGEFTLQLAGVEVDTTKLDVRAATYNAPPFEGVLDDARAVDYYQFAGQAGELIFAEMNATNGDLDPFLVLADENLNELVFNDNTSSTRDARIAQFSLPEDGNYFLLAGRSGFSLGNTTGAYTLRLSAGAIVLNPGVLTATVEWSGDDDLNLFIRDPQNRVVSWSNPSVPTGGQLQVDSNTDCQTPSAQPVEHIYWPETLPPEGDYDLWVWYQEACERDDLVSFDLTISAGEREILRTGSSLRSGERFNVGLRVAQNDVFLVEPGRITRPSPQQRASEGGDVFILYGQSVTGTLSDEVYAMFYQFEGARGDEVVIAAERLTGTLDPLVVLRDDTDTNLATNDDAGTRNRDALLRATLPDDGRYVIAVTRYGVREGTTTGDFELTLDVQGP